MVTTPVNVDVQAVFTALENWINRKPGLDPRDYGFDANGRAAYRSELRDIAKDKKRALAALDEARGLDPRPDLLMDAFKRAFSGRLEWILEPCNSIGVTTGLEPAHLEYTTGQYWPTEYRKAAASVLETYIGTWRQAYAKEHPPTFTYHTMDDVQYANAAVGGHWFDRSTMKFFNTKIESGLIGCGWVPATETEPARPTRGRFISSERGPDGVRRYTIREAQPDGSIDTIGEFQGYRTRDAARAAILK